MEDGNFDWFLTNPANGMPSNCVTPNHHIVPGRRKGVTGKSDELPQLNYPSPPVLQSDSDTSSPLPAPCTCLQTQANLLAYIRELSSKTTSPVPLHILLQTVKRSLEAMAHLSDCGICQREGISEEILLLVSMALRKTLRLFQNSCLSTIDGRGPAESRSAPASGMQSPSSMSPATSARGLSAGPSGREGCPTVITIEDHCLEGDDVDVVGHILAVRGLKRLTARVSALLVQTPHTERLGQSRGSVHTEGLEGAFEPVKEVLQALNPVVDQLEQSLRCRHRIDIGTMTL